MHKQLYDLMEEGKAMTKTFSDKQIIFLDLDGTLTASHYGIINACVYALNKFGIEVPDTSALMKFIGPPLLDSFQMFYGMDKETAARAVSTYREYYKDKGIFENEVYDGIPETLDRLKASGKRICLATSKPETFAVRILQHFELDQYFDIICGSDLSGLRDNKAAVIGVALEKTAELLGKTVDQIVPETIMIGDREHDVFGAAVHTMPCMGVLYGYGSEEELMRAGAAVIAARPEDVADILI